MESVPHSPTADDDRPDAAPPPDTETPVADTPPDDEGTPVVGLAYADLKLIRPLADAIRHAGYVHCTPVQESVIPQAMRGVDVIGQAQTGTGKTAAFLIPFLNRWRPHTAEGADRALSCAPTRELALQDRQRGGEVGPEQQASAASPVYGGDGHGQSQFERPRPRVRPRRRHARAACSTTSATRLDVAVAGREATPFWTKPTGCWTSASATDIEKILKQVPRRERQTLLDVGDGARQRSSGW